MHCHSQSWSKMHSFGDQKLAYGTKTAVLDCIDKPSIKLIVQSWAWLCFCPPRPPQSCGYGTEETTAVGQS